MARRVFFHIGAPKSGTTFLQAVLWENRGVLRRQGVLFPGDFWQDRAWSTNIVRERSNLPHERARTSWDRLVAQTQAFEGTVIISHEFFAAASREQAQRAIDRLAPAEVHVVYSARDYARQVPALWQEQLKFRSTTPLSEYEPAPLTAGPGSHFGWRALDVVDVLERWGAGLPPDRVHVVTVPPRGSSPDLLWQRFATLCGIDPESCDTRLGRANQSLGAAEAELLRRVNPRISDEIRGAAEVPRWVRDYLGHAVLVPRGGERIALGRQQVEQLRAKSQEAVQALEAAGYDVVGDLHELIPPADPPAGREPDAVTDAELLDVALDAIAVMLKDQRDLTRERNQWRVRARRRDRQRRQEPQERQDSRERLGNGLRAGLGAVRRRLRARL